MPNGLYNTGSICFYNSLIQALYACKLFKKSIETMYKLTKDSPSNKLIKLAAGIFLNDKLEQRLVDAFRFVFFNEIQIRKHFITSGQQCSNEFFVFLVEFLDDEYATIMNVDKSIEFNKPLEKLFKIDVEKTFTCKKCGESHSKIDSNIMHIHSSDSFAYTEDVDLTCDKCGNTGFKMNCKIGNMSYICLMYTYLPKLINIPINFSRIHKYKISSGIIHHGSPSGGHYFAFGLNGDKYYTFNDSRVSDYNILDAKTNSHIVMRFYERTKED